MSHRINIVFISYLTGLSVTSILGVTPVEARAYATSPLGGYHPVSRELIAQASTDATATDESEASSTASPDEDTSILKLGSRGERVSELQAILQKLGYYESKPDGIFGDQTKSAVIEFQRQANLPVDGQVGESTLQQLQEAIASSSETNPDTAPQPTPSATPEAPPTPTGETEPETTSDTANVAGTSERSGQGWIAVILAASAVVGFALYRYTRPRIKRLAPSKMAPSAVKESNSERSPDEPVATPTQVVSELTEVQPVTREEAPTNGVSANGVSTNGTAGVTLHLASEAIPAEISPVNETTRLAKVDIVDELIDDLRSPDPVKRRKAIWELGQVGDSKAVQPLVDLMMDADSSQRSLILAAISEIGVRTLKPMNRALLLSLQDHSSDVRKNAIRDVTRVYDLISQMSELLAHAASDPDAEVQETARWALGQLGRIRSVPELSSGASLSNRTPEHLPGDV
ncbi:peptidoglycan-binding protein [Oscillatoria sp. FACHB-1407]|uniref:peptidoglycan-binding protein n=1 Tax=Oscillatoria sp. FACHB-1407 TaxID=2692847 RepID=UPI001688D4DE|nr:peptidoglycan-binding protein [Oscillatoria sp. FACHB-1407]MBD2464942.1 peptidoglycan-binding protein [Oscillatoria sp. FACHB-1407]